MSQAENTDSLQNFGRRLYALSEKHGISQAEIARRLGVKPQRVGNWFQGKNGPGKKLAPLAALLGTSPDWLLKGEYRKANRPTDSALGKLSESHTQNYVEKAGESIRHGIGEISVSEVIDPEMVVNPRYASKGPPSTRKDCEAYFAMLMEAAQMHGDADDFPAIMKKLKKTFPLSDYEARES